MSDLQQGRSRPGVTQSDQRLLFVVSAAVIDLDWAEWVTVHLDGLGYRSELLDPPLRSGDAALEEIAALRSGPAESIVIVSAALLQGASAALHLDQLSPEARPLIAVLIEDVVLPATWNDALLVPMFQVPDDYHASRDLLLAALDQITPHRNEASELDRATAEAAARRRPQPAPVVIDAFPLPPAPTTPAAAPVEPATDSDWADTSNDRQPPESNGTNGTALVPETAQPADATQSTAELATADEANEPADLHLQTAEALTAQATTSDEAASSQEAAGSQDLSADTAAEARPATSSLFAARQLSDAPTLSPSPAWFGAEAMGDAPVAAAPPAPVAADRAAATNRPGSGLLRLGGGTNPWQAAQAGGASVTETESEATLTASADTASTAAEAALADPDTDAEQVISAVPVGLLAPAPTAPAPLAAANTATATFEEITPVADTELPEPPRETPTELVGMAGVLRLPFHSPVSLWSVDPVLELLEQGLQSRCGEQTTPPVSLFGTITAPNGAPKAVTVALTGSSGIGKSVIALTHGHRQATRLDVVWWVRGHTQATVRADLRALAVAVGVGASDTDGLLAGLRTKLEQGQDRWLVIIDGLEPDVSLESLLPTQGRGQVLLTCPFEPAGADCVAIGAPSATVAVRALADARPADAVAEPLDDEALDTLGARLASEPWGLALAARHLASGQASPGRLAAQLNRPPAVGGLDSSQVTSASEAALLVVLDAWQRHRPQAVAALLATSMLGSGPLRQTDLDRLAPGGENATTPDQLTSPERVDGAPAVLLLTSFSQDGATRALLWVGDDHVAMVSSLGRALRRLEDGAGHQETVQLARNLVSDALPLQVEDSAIEFYAPHAVSVLAADTDQAAASPDSEAGSGAAITVRLRTVIAGWHERLGMLDTEHTPPPREPVALVPDQDLSPAQPSDERLADLRTRSLAAAQQGNYLEATRNLEELVARTEAASGSNDLHTLSARTDLANALIASGSQHRAHLLLAKVLDDTRQSFGEDHPATLLAMHNLANSHADLGRHPEALALRESVLGARLEALGAEHPQTVSAKGNLANSLAALGRSPEALGYREAVADVRRRNLGFDHPQTLGALNNLANSYAEVGRHADALRLRQEVLQGREQTLGADHPHTLTARNNLANSLAAVGRDQDARRERATTLTVCERVLGADHPHTITARANLAFSSALRPTPRAGPAEATPVFGSHGYGPPTQSRMPTLGVGGGLHPAEEATPSKRKRFWFFRR